MVRRRFRSWSDGARGYFRALWSGTEPLHRVVISDMLIGGTLINVVAMAVALVLFGLEAPGWLAATVFFSALPYNFFLVAVVWRTAEASRSVWALPTRVLAVVWAGCMFFI